MKIIQGETLEFLLRPEGEEDLSKYKIDAILSKEMPKGIIATRDCCHNKENKVAWRDILVRDVEGEKIGSFTLTEEQSNSLDEGTYRIEVVLRGRDTKGTAKAICLGVIDVVKGTKY